MSLHVEVMRPEQTRVLALLAPLARDLGFYLAGGTAIALHLGHRRSYDLDWNLRRMLDTMRRKYGTIDESSILLALTYFEDGEKEPMPEMLVPLTWERAKERFRRLARDAVHDLRGSR